MWFPWQELFSLWPEGGERSAPMLCELEVQGEPVEFETDTGSPYTIMGNDSVKRILGCCVLDRSKVKIRSFTGHSVQVLGTMDVNVKVSDRLIEARIIVTEYKHNLSGRDLIDKLGVLTISLVKDADTDTMKAALDRHPMLFKEELGKFKGVQAKVHVDGDWAPIFFKPRPLPYSMRKKAEEDLQRLKQDEVTEPVEYSDWAEPIIPVLKPNGQVCICGDYKVTVNKASKLDQDPVPTLEDLITRLGKGSVGLVTCILEGLSWSQRVGSLWQSTPTKVCSNTNASPTVFPVHQLSSRGLWSPCFRAYL